LQPFEFTIFNKIVAHWGLALCEPTGRYLTRATIATYKRL